MSKSKALEFSYTRYFVIGALLLALLAAAPLSVAASGLSGNDAYDPAAGSYPELFVSVAPSSFSGDDAYDPAAGGYPVFMESPIRFRSRSTLNTLTFTFCRTRTTSLGSFT